MKGVRPLRAGTPPGGVYRVWTTRERLLQVVGAGGVTFWTPGGTLPGGYLVSSFLPLPPREGWRTLLRWTPVGTVVSQVAQTSQARGTSIKILRHRGGKTECRFPSKRSTWLDSNTFCTLGRVSHPEWKHFSFTRAGDTWAQGGRPRVRGVAMNPIDHPHGGGQGKTSGGRPGVTPWGRLTKGWKTK